MRSTSCTLLVLDKVKPLALKTRPNGVSCGKTVWQASQARPVWRAKLGTASAFPATAAIAMNPSRLAGNLRTMFPFPENTTSTAPHSSNRLNDYGGSAGGQLIGIKPLPHLSCIFVLHG